MVKFLAQKAFVWLAIIFLVPNIKAMEQSFSCAGNSDSNSGCFSRHALTDDSYQFFKNLFDNKEYQSIEDACVTETHTVMHYLLHTSIEYLQTVFDTITSLNYEIKTQTYTWDTITVKNGLLRYVLTYIAAQQYKINIDHSIDMVRNVQEYNRKEFKPSQLKPEVLIELKKSYLSSGEIPVFVITQTDLELYLDKKLFIKKDSFWWFNFYSDEYLKDLEQSLADISNHWLTLNRYYSLIEYLKTNESQEIENLFKRSDKYPTLAMILKFISAYSYQKNLAQENCVEIVDQIKEYLENSRKDHFYGLTVGSDQYPWLPYLIIALFQLDCECPLIAHNVINHPCMQNNSKNYSGFTCENSSGGATSLGSTYEFAEKIFLAIKRYDWFEDEHCYKIGALVFKEFDDVSISFGPWNCSTI